MLLLQALLSIEDCSEFEVSTSLLTTTSYGLPALVENARVQNAFNSSSDCIIEWDHDPNDRNILRYEVSHESVHQIQRKKINKHKTYIFYTLL